MRTRGWIALGCAVLLATLAAGCAPPPKPPPNPLIECDSLAGPISYSPPATGVAVDTTVTVGAGFSLSGCTDHTGRHITSGAFSGSLLLPEFGCLPVPAGVVWGTGSGQINWSNGDTSSWSASLGSAGPGQAFPIELTFTAGLWKGATASVPVRATAVDGNCTESSPLSSATFSSTAPFVLHPKGTSTRPPLTGATAVAAGGYHSCAVMPGGSIKCWGQNGSGQLGNGTFSTDPATGFGSTVAVDVVGILGATQVDAGQSSTCALLAGGTVKCWGENGFGQLGNGTFVDSAVPVTVTGVSGATALATGTQHACAVLGDGTVTCWGKNNEGQLGDGTTTDSNVPVATVGLTGASSISAAFHTCAIVDAGAVKCWGSNWSGELGNGTSAPSSTPVDVVGITDATSIDARPFHHSCATVPGGAVRCWGSNALGELGDGTTDNALTPVPMGGVSDVAAVSLGYGHSCVVVAGGSVSCRGYNVHGQLGDGTLTNSIDPVSVGGLVGATALASGYDHTCALREGGRVTCWGFNRSGQVGNGSTAEAAPPGDVILSL